jgi:L-fucose isomerase-like protein
MSQQTQPPPPLGVLTIGRKRPGFDQQWNEIMLAKAAAALGAVGVRTAGAEAPVVDEQTTRAALDRLRQAGCRVLLVLQPSLGNGHFAMTVAQRWDWPVVLWATPERPDGEKVSSCSLVAQHLWASVMRQLRRPFEFVYGDPDDAGVRQSLQTALAVSSACAELHTARLGLVGAHAPGFLAMEAEPFAMQDQLGVQLHRLSLAQFMERVGGIDDRRVTDDVDRVRSLKLPMTGGVTAADLPTNSRFYLAMRELMAEEALDALAVQEWPEFGATLGQWPYLAMSRLADEGEVVAMEGDADGAVTALAGRSFGGGVGYLTDWLEHDESTIHFWHAGMAPLGWIQRPTLGPHFNIAKPLVVDGPLKPDEPMTVARVWRVDGKYRATAFEGRTIPNGRGLTGNTALVEVAPDAIPGGGGDVRLWFDQLLHAGLPHHVALFRGHHRERFRRLARMLQIEWLG